MPKQPTEKSKKGGETKPVKVRHTKGRLLDDNISKRRWGGRSVASVFQVMIILAVLLALGGYYYFIRSNVADTYDMEDIVLPQTEDWDRAVSSSSQESQDEIAEDERETVVIRQVVIEDTGTGFLNVRSGPGTNNERIAQVRPGEIYEFLSEDVSAGWYEILLDDGTAGWVINIYASMIE